MAEQSRAADAGAADDRNATPPTRGQVVMSFVIGVAAFGFGVVACGSYLFGILRVPAWLLAVGAIGMVVGTGLILGGGFGGIEARSKRQGQQR